MFEGSVCEDIMLKGKYDSGADSFLSAVKEDSFILSFPFDSLPFRPLRHPLFSRVDLRSDVLNFFPSPVVYRFCSSPGSFGHSPRCIEGSLSSLVASRLDGSPILAHLVRIRTMVDEASPHLTSIVCGLRVPDRRWSTNSSVLLD